MTRLRASQLLIPETAANDPLFGMEVPLAPPGELDLSVVGRTNDMWARSDPTLMEQLGAAFSRLNTVPMLGRVLGDRPIFEPDPDFNPRSFLKGEEWDLPPDVRGRLLEAKSLAELEYLRTLQRRFASLDQIMQSGPLPGFLAGLIAVVLDPVNLLPMGWAAAPVRFGRLASLTTRGAVIQQSAAAGALVGVAGNAIVEPLMHMDDPFRTMADSFVDVLIGGAFGAALGGAIGLAVSGSVTRAARAAADAQAGVRPERDAVRNMAALAEAARIGADPNIVIQAAKGAEDAANTARAIVEGGPGPGRADPHAEPIAKSLSAAAHTDQEGIALRALRTEGLKVIGHATLSRVSKALSKLPLGMAEWPGLTLATSRFDAARRFIASVADTGIQTRLQRGEMDEAALEAAFKQAEADGWTYGREEFMRFAREQLQQGVPMADLAPLFSRISAKHNILRLAAQDIFSGLRSELDAAGIKLSDKEVDAALAQQAHFMAAPEAFGGVNPVRPELQPYLEKTILRARKELLEPLIEEARRVGVFGDAQGAMPDPNYWPLLFDTETIRADPGRFRAAIIDMLKAEKARAEAVVQPYEQAMERWRREGEINRKSRLAGYEAAREGRDPTGLTKRFTYHRQKVGRANRHFDEADSAIRRGEYLAEGQTPEQWATDLAARFAEQGDEWKTLYRKVRAERTNELKEAKRVALLDREKATPEEQARIDAYIRTIDATLKAEAEIDATNVKRVKQGERILSPNEERAVYLNNLRAAGVTQELSGLAPRQAADDALFERFGVTSYDIWLAHRWLKTRVAQVKAQREYDAFRAANNEEWKRITKEFVRPEDRFQFPDGYDMPTGYRGRPPEPPADYLKYKRKIRGTDENGNPARLADDASIAKEADEIVQNMTVGTDPYRFAQTGLRAHLKGRGLEPDWKILSPFLRQSFASTIDSYITMVPRDIETFKTFGDIREEAFIKPLADEASRMQNIVLAPEQVDGSKLIGDMKALHEKALKMDPAERRAEAAAIGRDMERQAGIMRALVAQARGTYIQPPKTIQEAKFRAALQTGMNLMFLTRMGSGYLAQIGDLTKSVLHFGLTRFLGEYVVQLGRALAHLGKTDPDALRAMKEFGVGGEGRLLDQQRLLYDVAPAEHQGRLGRALAAITPTFSRLTLMPFANDMLRRTAVNLVQDDFYKLLMTKDGRSADMRALVSQAGFRSDDIEKLRQFAKDYAKESPSGAVDFHIEKWAHLDWELADRFRSAIHMAAQRSSITPTAADAPLWTQTNIGRVAAQFKRFVFASFPQLLIPALQSPGLRKLEVAIAAVVFGTISTVLRDLNATGKVKDRNAGEWVLDALDMSGLTSMLTEVDATLFKINPNLSARYLLIGETPARFMDRSLISTFLGPLAGFYETTLARAIDTPLKLLDPNREVGPRNIAAFREMLPYQNHIILRHPLDLAEAALGGREKGPAVEWIGR